MGAICVAYDIPNIADGERISGGDIGDANDIEKEAEDLLIGLYTPLSSRWTPQTWEETDPNGPDVGAVDAVGDVGAAAV